MQINNVSELQVGMVFSLSTGGAACYSCVVSVMVHGEISRLTEKAVELRILSADNRSFEGKTFWLPLKALAFDPAKGSPGKFIPRLQRWFRPSGWTATCLDKGNTTSGISAAP